MAKGDKISNSVIRRLPRYYRFLGELLREGTLKISSRELAERMRLTASQIRQDLNCFGGLGQHEGCRGMIQIMHNVLLKKRGKAIKF